MPGPWKRSEPLDLLLALQGGGAHGAFTWGVLDRLLEEPAFGIEAVSATSSGAVNAVAMAHGWIQDGREGARTHLARTWQRIGEKGALASWGLPPAAGGVAWLTEFTRHLTPAQLNPLGLNPLADLLDELIDFERIRAAPPFRLHVAATRVRDGALVLFTGERLTCEAVLASACLPQLFRAVEIDGDAHWDGGYAGNPALAPLVYEARARDLLCVLVQPLESPRLPTSAREIADRALELTFSTTFLRELEALATNQQLIRGKLALTSLGRRLQSLRLHLVEPGASLAEAGGKAKLDTRPAMLGALCALGRERAGQWLEAHRSALGSHSSWSLPAG
ncbi:patatin-like phospholipase family protein [Luteimonas sp. RD2P54]|uniref:Patatin-like phospholipase family protein n=1 Tax=Luteimonas endophytica TaxID=3042023 RepID=A0ABT6JA40_9GAMM|nr:patatin-like phospholipase family protein [Luteimonas endophytica]MDH5823689.1 patatin-like phospholipase family protein [Luteimonas endophytica]